MRLVMMTILFLIQVQAVPANAVTDTVKVGAADPTVLVERFQKVSSKRQKMELTLDLARSRQQEISRHLRARRNDYWFDVPNRVQRDRSLRQLRRGKRRVADLEKRLDEAERREEKLGLKLRRVELKLGDEALAQTVEGFNEDRLKRLEATGADRQQLGEEKRYFERRMKLRPHRKGSARVLKRLERLKKRGRLDD